MKNVIFILCAIFLMSSCKDNSTKTAENTKQVSNTVNDGNKIVPQKGANRGIAHSQPQQKLQGTEIRQVSIEEAKQLAQQGYTFLDIRTKEEIERGKIKDAMEMNVKAYDFQSNVNLMDRDIKLIVYCSAGNRSALASKLFSTLGFTNVVEMPGGYSEWRTKHNQ